MNQSSANESRPKTDTVSKAELFIFSFIKAKSDLLIFPPTNPVVNESMEKALSLMQESFGGGRMIELLIEKERLMVDGVVVGSNDPRVDKLSLALYRRGIRKIIIDPSITFDELRMLLDALNMKAEDLAEAGGIAALLESRGIARAAVEETAELTIVDGTNLPIADDMLPSLEGLEDLDLTTEELESPESFNRMFVRVEDGNMANVKRLRKLLANPELFSGLLEKFALQLEKADESVDAGARVTRMLEMLQTVGSAIASLPSEGERSTMMKNVAVSVLGLSASLRTELVNQGIMPNLALRSIESSILSQFPIVDLADAILENFQVSGGTASVMSSYLRNIDIDGADRSELVESLQYSLRQSGALSPEVEDLLASTRTKADTQAEKEEIEAFKAAKPKDPRLDFDLPQIEGYSPEKLLFLDNEKAELLERMSKELDAPAENIMGPTLMELLNYERSPQNYASLIERVCEYIDILLSNRDYDNASDLIHGLQNERENKAQIFSDLQMKPLDEAIGKYMGEHGIRRLISNFKGMKQDSSDFRKVTEYFSTLGAPAISALLTSLTDEQSRHVRLLTCKALAEIGEKGVDVVAERLAHQQWFVVRNAVSILGQIGAARCVPHLHRALSHPEPRVRREALKGLASIRTDEAIDRICECVRRENGEMCKPALEWIAVIGSERAFPSVERLLDGRAMWKMNEDLIRSAIEALGSMRAEPADELLERLTQVRRLFRRRKAAFIRETAAAALAKPKRRKG